MHKKMETDLSLLSAFRNSPPRQKDVHWLHQICYMGKHKSMHCQ